MKILVVGMNYAPEMIGCARYTTDLVQYLAAQGHRLEVVTTPPHYPGWRAFPPYRAGRYGREMTGEIGITRCPLALGGDGQGVWRLVAPATFAMAASPVLAWRARTFKPDLILVIVPSLAVAPAALLAARLARAPLVLHVQDLEVDAAFAVGHLRGGWLRRASLAIERWLLGRAAAVVSISTRMCDRLAAKGIRPERLFLVRNWVDTSAIHPAGHGGGFRRQHAIPTDAFVAMYAGHIGAKQALDVLLEAARLSQYITPCHFLIVGDGPLRRPLQQRYGSLANVQWLPVQPEAALCDMLNAADVHLLPQKSAAADLVLPSKLGGMLACGKPMIVAAEPGTELHDVLQGAAWLIAPDDPGALASAVGAVYAQQGVDPHAQARRGLARQLEREQQLPRFAKILESLVAGLAGQGPANAATPQGRAGP